MIFEIRYMTYEGNIVRTEVDDESVQTSDEAADYLLENDTFNDVFKII